jgi:hypothetical protein
VTGKSFYLQCVLFFLLATSFDVSAQSRGRNQEQPPPQIYKERAISLFRNIAGDEFMRSKNPFSDAQKEQLKEIMREEDAFLYNQPKGLEIKNPVVNIGLRERQTIVVNLGHNYTTSLTFTDAMGNPWSVETLTDVSNTDVVSINKNVPHIISVRPKVMSGQTNLPIKLKGEQYPITLLFNVNSEVVDFNVDLRADGLGDHVESQRQSSLANYMSGEVVPPKLTQEPEKELMLQFITPEGYVRRGLLDDYGNEVDPRDFVAWSKGNRLFIMTPHHSYSPDPVDISAASDGRHRLLEYPETPFILVRKDSQLITLLVK